ncbi:uncharacterized protein CTRU02_202005 [Colletotrichum truncatum]|uniref:Uncharacterized protein n=1 Tax=Colletotrichum truncatum TaxID=5467 RepID=A0ACC3ZJ15_COLTU|nr:uncharacterized protein CTRU02_07122 [Colletotrichum truncatum]KAF6791939.1 hypothetical protein CTRU02_07122 [Colletotrichum truncatum]
MGRKSLRAESFSDMEDGGAKLNTPMDDAMEIDSTPVPVVDKKKAAADARAERAARRKQRREELAAQGQSTTSSPASTPNPEAESTSPTKKTRRKRPEKKSSPKKSDTAETEADAPVEPAVPPESVAPEALAPATEPVNTPANEAEHLPLATASKPVIANTETSSPSASEPATSIAPSSINGDGLNRAARRRLMQIERQRILIKKELGIAADSDERQVEVEALLTAWTEQFDEKAEARAAKKRANKEGGNGKGKGKLLTGRINYEKQKQIKKQKRKEALRRWQEASSGTS